MGYLFFGNVGIRVDKEKAWRVSNLIYLLTVSQVDSTYGQLDFRVADQHSFDPYPDPSFFV
jgi:hypothetical protein